MRNFGISPEEFIVEVGINSKMDELRAAYGLLNLRRVEEAMKQCERLLVGTPLQI